jgi:hypothetical protein
MIEIAGYWLCVVAGLSLLAIATFVLSWLCVHSTNKAIRALIYRYSLSKVREVMRKMEADGTIKYRDAKWLKKSA